MMPDQKSHGHQRKSEPKNLDLFYDNPPSPKQNENPLLIQRNPSSSKHQDPKISWPSI